MGANQTTNNRGIMTDTEVVTKDQLTTGAQIAPLVPTTFDGMYRLANIMAKSGMMPKGLDRPEQVFVAIQMGAEIGLSPIQSVQSIAVINGRPTVWGDAMLGLCQSSPDCERITEEPITDAQGAVTGYRCTAYRRGYDQIVRTFTVLDAKTAKLWGKRGKEGQDTPWITYPQRMLQMRARAWCLRDAFADVLRGVGMTEEWRDIPDAIVENGEMAERQKALSLHPAGPMAAVLDEAIAAIIPVITEDDGA